MPAAIECQHVCLERERGDRQPLPVLDDISTTFHGGRINLICGPTGAGKTSLLHVLGGLLRPSSGQVLADGQPVSRWTGNHRSRWRRRVGIAFQHHHLFEDLTALENVLVPLVPRGYSLFELRRLGRQALAALDMAALAGEKILALSGGQRQRVNLARALVSCPDYLLLDEPTAHQDSAAVAMILGRLVRTRDKDATTVIVVAHDVRLEASADIDARFRLAGGRLERVG